MCGILYGFKTTRIKINISKNVRMVLKRRIN